MDRWRSSATAIREGWLPITEPGLQAGWSAPHRDAGQWAEAPSVGYFAALVLAFSFFAPAASAVFSELPAFFAAFFSDFRRALRSR